MRANTLNIVIIILILVPILISNFLLPQPDEYVFPLFMCIVIFVVAFLNILFYANNRGRHIALLALGIMFIGEGISTFRGWQQAQRNNAYVYARENLVLEPQIGTRDALVRVLQFPLAKRELMSSKGIASEVEYQKILTSIYDNYVCNTEFSVPDFIIPYKSNYHIDLVFDGSCIMVKTDWVVELPNGTFQPVALIQVYSADERKRFIDYWYDSRPTIEPIGEPIVKGINMITGEVMTDWPLNLRSKYEVKYGILH